ncbi:hypothetical protein COL23_25610 [Priestia aryabhattai]|uniref:hypothetical protein n=1 Tax=Priestia aryabhattai TaxID=412384 RepID=UPI000BF660F3|nr:hypothetical protein [Priestia aryabhattai]PFW72130.1 hypothetical protein COL23_25610 [Priestia aryabhattai]
MSKKPLYELDIDMDNQKDTAKSLMETNEVKKEKPNEPEVQETSVKVEDTKQEEPKPEPPLKKKTNRGRPRLYKEGEMIKLSVLLDKSLAVNLKMAAKRKGTTVQDVIVPYMEKWLEENHEVENSYIDSDNKGYTGFNVKPEFRQKFSDACTDRRRPQGFVLGGLYEQALKDLKGEN